MGVTGPPVVRLATVGIVPASRVAGRVECRTDVPAASDSFSAATDPTVPVSGASCRGPEGGSLKRSTWLKSGVEEWRLIATATKATLRSSIFSVRQGNSKQLSTITTDEHRDRLQPPEATQGYCWQRTSRQARAASLFR